MTVGGSNENQDMSRDDSQNIARSILVTELVDLKSMVWKTYIHGTKDSKFGSHRGFSDTPGLYYLQSRKLPVE